MKKIILLSFFLYISLSLVVTRIAAEATGLHSPKDMENLIDQTIIDVGKLVSAEPADKEGINPSEKIAKSLEQKDAGELIDLEFNQANIEDVLRIISEAGGINIALDPSLRGKKIDFHLKKITIKEALELLYNSYGLGSTYIGNVLFISTQEKIRKGSTKTKIVVLRNLNVEEARLLVGNLVNTANSSKEINTLILIGAEEDVIKAEKILRDLDKPQPQVLLEAKVIEINDDFLRELGLDWPDSLSFTFQEAIRPVTLGTAATTAAEELLHVYKFNRTATQFAVTLKMLENANKAKILSSPRIITLNNKEAQIFIGDKIPYTVNVVSGGATSTEVRFVEPGIRLKITPSIIDEDFVVIKIQPEVSYIYTFRGTGDAYPWVKSREATAYVRVKNGQPFIIGGLLSKEDKKNLYKVPFLGDIPFIGNIFSYEKKTGYNSDLIITVTPTIIIDKS